VFTLVALIVDHVAETAVQQIGPAFGHAAFDLMRRRMM